MSIFEGKTVVVTGGCSGIGYAAVENFLKQNIKNVAILDLGDPKNVTGTFQRNYPNKSIVFIKTDVAKKDQVKSAFDEVVAKFNYVDFIVANAGILSENDYELCLNVNLMGLSHTVFTGIDVMKKKDAGRGGVIISTASLAGLDPFPSLPAYTASKFGVVGLTRCLGTEYYYNQYGIKFMAICPGHTETAILNDLGSKMLDEGTLAMTEKVVADLPKQSADSVGRSIVEIIVSGANGSIWIVNEDKKQEVTFGKYFS